MWFKEYRDYPVDKPLRRQRVESGKGIIGCEMNDDMGWGEEHHRTEPEPPGLVAMLFSMLFGGKQEDR